MTRSFSNLYQDVKSSEIPGHVLRSHDENLHARWGALPEACQLASDAYMDPAFLAPIFTIQLARFILHRRNLSPLCQPPDRLDALHRCTAIAHETARCIAKTLKPATSPSDAERSWQAKVSQIASSAMCMHLWRCMLVLCLRAEYEAALLCLRLSSAIGNLRKVNMACGKNLKFFLDRLFDRIHSGNSTAHQLTQDEEMLAYVSGDMQGNLGHSWVWTASDFTPSQTSPHPASHVPGRTHGPDEPMQGTQLPLRSTPGSPENGAREWDGWGQIEQMIGQLIEEQRSRRVQQPSYYPPPHNPLKRVQLAADAPPSPSRLAAPAPPPTPSSSSRISIANII